MRHSRSRTTYQYNNRNDIPVKQIILHVIEIWRLQFAFEYIGVDTHTHLYVRNDSDFRKTIDENTPLIENELASFTTALWDCFALLKD
jgi:hypothetical protein